MWYLKNLLLRSEHSDSITPTITSHPLDLSLSIPLPSTNLLGSLEPITILLILLFIIASVHGGVLPWWLHGSRFTYKVDSLNNSLLTRLFMVFQEYE